MLDNPELTNFAVHKAREAGYERGSEGIFHAVEKIFNANMNHTQPEMPQPTPKFFAPPPAPQRNPSSIVSAPVSREIPSSTGKRPTPGRVTLSPQEVEAARVSGISIEDYAKNKLEYQRQLEAGEYRDNREQR